MDKRSEAKKYGIISENLFINECTTNNIQVFKNTSDIGEIDFIILCNNNAYKMQVKSTIDPIRNNLYNISTKRSSDKQYVNVDYFAIYLHKPKLWYIIPNNLIKTKQGLTINLDNDKYIDFRDNWNFSISKKPEEIEDHNVEKRNIAIDQFKSGKSKAEIARMLKIHYGTINVWLREAGYGIRKLSETKEKLLELYNFGKTMKEISIELGMSIWTIRNLFRKYDIPVRINNNPKGRRH